MKTFHEFLTDRPELEAIDLEHLGVRRFVILRSRQIPELGIVLDTKKERGTLFRACFIDKDRKTVSQRFLVACACCPIASVDAKLPERVHGREAIGEWQDSFNKPFHKVVLDACQTHGIKTLLFRHGELWDEKFGSISGTTVLPFYDFIEWFHRMGVLKRAFAGITFGQ